MRTAILLALLSGNASAIMLDDFMSKGTVEICYENPTDVQHRRTLLVYRAPIKDSTGAVHRLVEGWERYPGKHPTLLHGVAVLFSINYGEYDLAQVRLTRSFEGSEITTDTWYFDDYRGTVGGYHYMVACDAPWPIVQ